MEHPNDLSHKNSGGVTHTKYNITKQNKKVPNDVHLVAISQTCYKQIPHPKTIAHFPETL